jgi:hypothetical protein
MKEVLRPENMAVRLHKKAYLPSLAFIKRLDIPLTLFYT